MEREIKVGLIGFGMSGRVFHAPIITNVKGLNISKVFVRSEANIKILKERYNWVEVVSDIDEIIKDKDIELVVLAVPNSLHFELAAKCLNGGKNVVVEKPFTVTSKEADMLIEIASKNNKFLTIYQNRRWDSDFRTIRRLMDDKVLGEIVEYEAHFDRFRDFLRPNAWKEKPMPGSGLLYDLGSHLIDQAQCLFGLPERVFGDLRTQRKDSEIVDNFEVILSYPNLKVTLKAGMFVRDAGPRYTILGRKGSFIKYGIDVQEKMLNDNISPSDVQEWGKEPKDLRGRLKLSQNGLNIEGTVESLNGDYREFYKNVYKALLGQEDLEVTAIQGRNTIRIIELAEKSNEEGRWIKFE